MAHTGHSKVTTAFGEGDGGAKTASQLLDRRLKKSVVDTLIDSLSNLRGRKSPCLFVSYNFLSGEEYEHTEKDYIRNAVAI